jgi:chaperone modulatory protein CbpM
MIKIEEFLLRARLERGSLEAWVAAGWLVPPQTEPELMFSDVDLARVQLIRDLREDFGVNDEGVSLVLHLVDQVHGLRRSMQVLLEEMHAGRSAGSERTR